MKHMALEMCLQIFFLVIIKSNKDIISTVRMNNIYVKSSN